MWNLLPLCSWFCAVVIQTMKQLTDLLKQRILVLDGAMGTMIQRYELTETDFRRGWFEDHPVPLKGNNDLLSLTRPDIIHDIHKAYLDAGADIIETNTFSGTTVAQADYHLEKAVYDINFHSAQIARKLTDEYTEKDPNKPRFVAGSIGPTNRTASISPDVNDPGFRAITFDELVVAYTQQIEALLDGGCHILLVETIFDTLNAKAALYAIDEVAEKRQIQIPIMVSGTITDQSGRTLTGQTTDAFLVSVQHMPLLSIGLNCALGANMMRPYLQILSSQAPFAVSAHPNAGLPNEFGQYDETPEIMGEQIETFLKEGLINIIGGCCGTTPDHIRVMAELANKYSPRTLEQHV
jgi:5-methyltetrahydrofolate--homocysteine methyltransferase